MLRERGNTETRGSVLLRQFYSGSHIALAYSSSCSVLASALLQPCTFFRPRSCLVLVAGLALPCFCSRFCLPILLAAPAAFPFYQSLLRIRCCLSFSSCFAWSCPELHPLLSLPLPASASASLCSCLCLLLCLALFLLCPLQLFSLFTSFSSPGASCAANIFNISLQQLQVQQVKLSSR